jgi:ABC-2 type transport system permease protein
MSSVREQRTESRTGDDDRTTAASGSRSNGRPSIAASVEFTRIELLRGVRWLRVQDFWLLYMLISGVALLFVTWIAFDVARDVGAALATGESPTVTPAGIKLVWSVLWLFIVSFVIVDVFGSNGDLNNDGYYLTIRPTADVAGGKLLSTTCKFSVFVFVPVLGGYLGLALGADTPMPFMGGLAAAVAALVTATAIGYPIGLALKGFVRRSATLTRLKPVIGLGIGVAYVVVMFSGEFMTVIDTLEEILLAPPLTWLGDLGLLTTVGAGVDVLGAIGAVILTGFVAVVGTFLSTSASRYAWSADHARPGETDTVGGTDAPDHRVDALLRVVCREPATLAITSTTLLRAYRAPLQLVFVAFPLLAVIPLADQLLATGALPWYAPWFAIWYGAWAAGAAIPLNPLGNQGATLPALLTAPADGRHVVHGHVIAAVLPVAPLTTGLAVGIGYLAGRPEPELAVLAFVSVAAVVAAAVLATGIGSIFPRFEAVDFAGSRQAVPPSKAAYGVFSTVLTITVVAIGVVADETVRELTGFVLSGWLPFGREVTPDTLTVVGWAIVALVAISVPLAYRIAVRRVNAYRLG